MPDSTLIRPAAPHDVGRMTAIYNYYIRETVITFEEIEIDESEFQTRVDSVLAKGLPWLVCERDGLVVGYAYAGPFRKRSAYRFTVESGVYLAKDEVGAGVGSQLYQALIDCLMESKVHSVMGVIALPNPGSVRLHEKFGFEKVGVYQEVGWKFNEWVDVGCWQLILNRSR